MSVTYNPGDVVWVKAGTHWWPGEVISRESLPSEIEFKKEPFAIVGFFEEDSYEYVRNPNLIMFYKCSKKNAFIKKGMQAFRAKQGNMESFPRLVCIAETLTGGNPNILSDPEVLPQKKDNYVASLFGSPSPKKTPKGGKLGRLSKGSSSQKKKLGSSSSQSGAITHRRFLGYNDHSTCILIQQPEEKKEEEQAYNCTECTFRTAHIEVFMLHKKSHIQGVYTANTSRTTKRPVKKAMKIPRAKTNTIDEDLEMLQKGLSILVDGSGDEGVEESMVKSKEKRKRVVKSKKNDTEPKTTAPETQKVIKEKDKLLVQSVISEWDDDEEEEDEAPPAEPDTKTEEPAEVKDKENVEVEKTKKTDDSCFDFSEEEEEAKVVTTAAGRKIPRVIPEKTKPVEEKMDTSEPLNNDTQEPPNNDSQQEPPNKDSQKESENKEAENLDAVFDQLMEQTKAPELPHTLKYEQNFHDAKTIKFPDKSPPLRRSSRSPEKKEHHEVATKLTNPKKRFVKSFEDFELLQSAQKKELETQEKKDQAAQENNAVQVSNSNDKPLVSKLKTQLMSKLNNMEIFTPDKSDMSIFKEIKGVTKTSLKSLKKCEEVEDNLKQEESRDDSCSKLEEEIKSNTDEVVDNDVQKQTDVMEENKQEREKTVETDNVQKQTDVIEENKQELEKTVETEEAKVDEIELLKVDESAAVEELTKELINEKEEPPVEVETNKEVGKDSEDTSALATLARVSELSSNLESRYNPTQPEPELVNIDKNVTFLSEKELSEGQVEFANNVKPVTLSSFSLDFSECDKPQPVEEKDKSASESVVKAPETASDSKTEGEEKTDEKSDPVQAMETPVESEGVDLEEQIPSVTVANSIAKQQVAFNQGASNKLLNILKEGKNKTVVEQVKIKEMKINMSEKMNPESVPKLTSKIQKIIPQGRKETKLNKPTILSEKIIKPESDMVSVQKVTSKRAYQDVEDIEAFIIQKPKKIAISEPEEVVPKSPIKKFNQLSPLPKGKAKIIQQTIITPKGDIIQPETSQNDDFDINSMPIVLSDQILTPENIDTVPIVLSEPVPVSKSEEKEATPKRPNPVKILNKAAPQVMKTIVNKTTPTIIRTYTPQTKSKLQKVFQVGPKLVKTNPQPEKSNKYIIVPSSKTVVEKRLPLTKRVIPVSKPQTVTPEPTGNKIMIVTNQQGQQSRVLLTPAQQKLLGYQTAGTKVKTVKSSVVQKNLIPKGATPPNILTKNKQVLVSSSGQLLTPLTSQQLKTLKGEPLKKKITMQNQKVVIQTAIPKMSVKPVTPTVKKLQPIDDALLEQQVQEQLQAINKASTFKTQTKMEITPKQLTTKPNIRRSYVKKTPTTETVVKQTKQVTPKAEITVPPLAPISPTKKTEQVGEEKKPDRPLNQLIIQDALGNQTTITEGQILALPSETVDGQPQSYMLVTLDETGNLIPLNNEALMSLDPNLGLAGDLSNVVLQIDSGATQSKEITQEKEKVPEAQPVIEEAPKIEDIDPKIEPKAEPATSSNQQFIVTGDPVAAQKLIESLTEGHSDLANILASTENSSILIQADGQQILINPPDADNQMVLSINTENAENQAQSNPIFAAPPPSKSQDILAAALADTDMFQQESSQTKIVPSQQLSPNSSLYPMNVGNVLETSLTLSSPIMTPLEVPSTNNKKISDEETILTEVPKNVDLPITITDPNISQTVSQQQVALNELQSNLELPLTISEPSTSTELNSPSYIYNLPSLDGSVDITPKTYSSSISMPILSEDSTTSASIEEQPAPEAAEPTEKSSDANDVMARNSSFIEEEGLCTLGGEMCSSLSEPPPDMFDLSLVNSSYIPAEIKQTGNIPNEQTNSPQPPEGQIEENGKDSPDEGKNDSSPSPTLNVDESSCEIPVQPDIVTDLASESFDNSEENQNESLKRGLDSEDSSDLKRFKSD